MIKLLAKSQSGGRYYFCEDDDSVYLISSPLEKSEKEFIDDLPVFLRKSIDSDLTYDERDFNSIEELRAFAICDCDPKKRGISLKNTHKPLLDLLILAPIEIVEEYFAMIEDKINRKDFIGLSIFFKQLSRSRELLANQSLLQKRDSLWAAFDNARFSHVRDPESAFKAEERIRSNHNVLDVA